MKLLLAEPNQYNEKQLKALEPYLNKHITFDELIRIPVPMAIYQDESVKRNGLVIDHPGAW